MPQALQKRLTYISGSRDDVTRAELERANRPELKRAVWQEFEAESASVTLEQRPSWGTGSPGTDLEAVVSRLARRGCDDVLAVELTRPEMGLPVWKALIPGARGIYGACALPPQPRPVVSVPQADRPSIRGGS